MFKNMGIRAFLSALSKVVEFKLTFVYNTKDEYLLSKSKTNIIGSSSESGDGGPSPQLEIGLKFN